MFHVKNNFSLLSFLYAANGRRTYVNHVALVRSGCDKFASLSVA